MYLEKIVRNSNILENNNLRDMKNIKKHLDSIILDVFLAIRNDLLLLH